MALTNAQKAGIIRNETETWLDVGKTLNYVVVVGRTEVQTAAGPRKRLVFAGEACVLPDEWMVVRPQARVFASGWECAGLLEVPVYENARAKATQRGLLKKNLRKLFGA